MINYIFIANTQGKVRLTRYYKDYSTDEKKQTESRVIQLCLARKQSQVSYLVLINKVLDLPFPKGHILDSSKLKEFADANFKFDENGITFSKWVENTVVKGELIVTSNFSISHFVFKRPVLQT